MRNESDIIFACPNVGHSNRTKVDLSRHLIQLYQQETKGEYKGSKKITWITECFESFTREHVFLSCEVINKTNKH